MASHNEANAAFWNGLCGSHLARVLGITDDSPQSLARYDAWYLEYYSYLEDAIRFTELAGKDVLEIGLGYGVVGQRIAESGANYLGLDIAEGPVAMMRHRLAQSGLPGDARQAAFPESGLADASFDQVVAIGCFHHTGALQGCIAEAWRLLRPGGVAVVMVYNRHSYRHFLESPRQTLASVVRDALGLAPATPPQCSATSLAGYDSDGAGQLAPFTEFVSIRQAKSLFREFRSLRVWKENCADERIFGRWFKRDALRPLLGPLVGTDLYIRAEK